MKCDRENCENDAAVTVVLVCPSLTPNGQNWKLDLELGMKICSDHAEKEPDVKYYLNDRGWHRVKQGFQSRSLPVPKRKSLLIEFRPIKPQAPESTEGKILTL